jgi:dimethylamine--corrinoid protein Co-methyltransferase
MRTAGDLVARMQMTRGMRLEQAKAHVAGQLGVSTADLSDPLIMHEVRREFGLGLIPVQELTYPSEPGAIEAKFHISEVLDVPINSVQKFTAHIAPRAAARPVGAGAVSPRPEVAG